MVWSLFIKKIVGGLLDAHSGIQLFFFYHLIQLIYDTQKTALTLSMTSD